MPTLLTFGNSKDSLRMVVDNGVDVTDPRVLTRTNEATQVILTFRDEQGSTLIPVNGMMIVDIVVGNDGFFVLPPEMDSVSYFKVISGGGVNGQIDVTSGHYNIVNPATYLEPGLAFDNPLVDHFYTGVQQTNTLQRRYFYPGFKGGTIRAVGPKAYMPIVDDNSVLIIQNVAALKTMMIGLEYKENNQGTVYEQYKEDCRKEIEGDVKRYNMDPRWVMRRKADYEADLAFYAQGSMGWTRARIALEVPGAMDVGKEDIGRILNRAQLRMMEAGTFKGCIEEFNATITDGFVYIPSRAESIIAANLCGMQLDVRSIFYKYMESGPGEMDCACAGGMLEDAGDVYFPNSTKYRRKYRSHVGTDGSELSMACKLRWEEKDPDEQLVIRNFEANRVMVHAMLLEQSDKWPEAAAAMETVIGDGRGGRPLGILHKELKEYLRGIQQIANFAPSPGVGDLGMVM